MKASAWGAQSPPGRVGSSWCQAGREEMGLSGCWPERYTPPPGAWPGCYWLLRDTGTPSHSSMVGGNSQTWLLSASVPFSPWHHSQSKREGAMGGKSAAGLGAGEWLGGRSLGWGGIASPTSDPSSPIWVKTSPSRPEGSHRGEAGEGSDVLMSIPNPNLTLCLISRA